MTHSNKENPPTPQWKARALLLAIGAVIAVTGWAAIHEGYWWIFMSGARAGTGFAPMLDFVFVGGALIILGLIPWKPIRTILDRWLATNRRG